jgi:hypothetical protein
MKLEQITIAVLCMCLATTADAQNFLQKLNNGLQNANNALAGNHQTTTGPAKAQPTDAQLQELAHGMASPLIPAQIQPMWQQAHDNIAKVLLDVSCYPGFDVWKYLGRYKAPGSNLDHSLTAVGAMSGMKYHSKSACVTVTRIGSWQPRANNAFAFKVLFVADDSGESVEQNFELVRQPDGDWLFN